MSNVHVPKVWRKSEILCSNIGKKNKCSTYQMENETKLQNGYFVTLMLLWSAILEGKLMPFRYLSIPDVLTKSSLYSQKRHESFQKSDHVIYRWTMTMIAIFEMKV